MPVPSGDLKPRQSLEAYRSTLGVHEKNVRDLTRQMMAIDSPAIIRDPSGTRVVGVGVEHNESGLILLSPEATPPQAGAQWPDGRKCTIVEKVAPHVFYYETT